MSELGDVLGKRPGVFQRGLNSLEEQGYIVSRRLGNMRMIRINTDHTLFDEIKGIVSKTYGVEASLKRSVEPLFGIPVALIYGSYAKDTMRADSDIDLLVVCDSEQAESRLLSGIEKFERLWGREINYKLYHSEEFARKRKTGDAFLKDVLCGPHILLKGEL